MWGPTDLRYYTQERVGTTHIQPGEALERIKFLLSKFPCPHIFRNHYLEFLEQLGQILFVNAESKFSLAAVDNVLSPSCKG